MRWLPESTFFHSTPCVTFFFLPSSPQRRNFLHQPNKLYGYTHREGPPIWKIRRTPLLRRPHMPRSVKTRDYTHVRRKLSGHFYKSVSLSFSAGCSASGKDGQRDMRWEILLGDPHLEKKSSWWGAPVNEPGPVCLGNTWRFFSSLASSRKVGNEINTMGGGRKKTCLL